MRDFEMTNDDGSNLDEPIPYRLGPEAIAIVEAPAVPRVLAVREALGAAVRWVELESEAS